MPEITPKQLATVNLRFDRTARSLKALAYAHLVAKALFLYGNKKTDAELARHVANLLGISSVSEELIHSGLDELVEIKKVTKSDNKWSLKKEARQEIGDETTRANAKFLTVIDRHFPKDIEASILTRWLYDALVDFFVYYGDEWVASISKGLQSFKGNLSYENILKPSLQRASLFEEAKRLNNAFEAVLSSTLREDQEFLTDVGYAMFSARLVASDVGADPITIDELRGATFVVDTNFLIALHLDSHRFAVSLAALGKALSSIDAKLVYLDETKGEYGRVWSGKKGEILKLCEVYQFEVISDVDDDFIKTALSRHCKTIEDFERFFSDISNIPTSVPNGPDIKLHQDEKVIEFAQKAKSDKKLKSALQGWNIKLKPFWNKTPKSSLALDHDAALLYVTEYERKSGNNMFILTLDRSLQSTSAERSGEHEIPQAIYLGGLIQILAAYNAGPNFDASNFAPIMSSILRSCIPPEHTFATQDLHWLYRIERNVANLTPQKIKAIAVEVAKRRMAGKKSDDKGLERTINRLYQEEVQDTDSRVEESLNRARTAEEQMELERQRRIKAESELNEKNKQERKRLLQNKLFKSLAWRIPLSLIFSYLAFRLINVQAFKLDPNGGWNLFISILELLVIVISFIKNPIESYKKAVSDIK